MAVECGQAHRQGRLGRAPRELAQEVLPVDRDEERPVVAAELPEAAERLAVVGQRLRLGPAAERRVEDRLLSEAVPLERLVDVVHVAAATPRTGGVTGRPVDRLDRAGSFEVRRRGHLDDCGVMGLADPGHLRVGKATDVVDGVEPALERRLGNLVVARLDREDGVAGHRLERLDGGVQPVELLVGGEHLQALVRRLQPDVDDVGALPDQLLVHVAGGLAGVVEHAGVVRRLRGDVEHAHDPRRVVLADAETGGVHVSHTRTRHGRTKAVGNAARSASGAETGSPCRR